MGLIRPRLTDFHGISVAQSELDFAIPFVSEDIPLYVDPFLLWRSPSQQDQSLHTALVNSFNRLNWLVKKGNRDVALSNLIIASECDEVGLGQSAKRKGKRIGLKMANEVIDLFRLIPQYGQFGFSHFEEIQLFAGGISRDRVSDIACSFLKSFLIDYTIDQCTLQKIPLARVTIESLYDYREHKFIRDARVDLPVNPESGAPIIFVPKRWLRFIPWISFEDYFANACPKDDLVHGPGVDERVSVLRFNRDNYGVVESYVKEKERSADECRNDPLFKQIPVLSARRKLGEIKKLPTGKGENADRQYEEAAAQLLASLLYPHLDFATTQSRSDGGATIRDLVFYNNRSVDFLQEILADYSSRQIVMEMKNVKSIDRDHVNQLNRYLTAEFGGFGVFVTRNPLSRAMLTNTIELWSGQRRCIISLNDEDLDLMVNLYESKQRLPIDVLKKKYLEFRRACPS